jgi:two-component system nitrogen regulation response regulator GlnG
VTDRGETTDELSDPLAGPSTRRIIALTILAHADIERIGDRVVVPELVGGETIRISRIEPRFAPVRGGRTPAPIGDRFVSRLPVALRSDGDGIAVDAVGGDIVVGGTQVDGIRRLSASEIDDGVTIELGRRVALLLHRIAPTGTPPPELDLIGDSDALDAMRATIVRVADLDVPVLVRGESGSGKELVARALHARSGRSGPLISVNVAAIPPATASSALFGHARGAFTGAVSDQAGHFRDADGGTLFLDEIGEIPLDVQASLLRAIETGEIQPVGAARPVRVDVRVVAATDRDLDVAIARGAFRDALLHRLTGLQIAVPPLRARRDDIGRLLLHFLRQDLSTLGGDAVLADSTRRHPWLPAPLVAAFARHPWPGNVRQLRNAVRQLAVASRGRDHAVIDATVRALIERDAPAAIDRDAAAVTPDAVVEALRRNAWSYTAAAAELGVTRARLYTLATRAGRVRTARDVTREEIAAALDASGNRTDDAAARLEISPRALALRMNELGMNRR